MERLLDIEAKKGDDPAYIDTVTSLIVGALHGNGLDSLTAVRVDSWFDRKWLGYSGKGVVRADQFRVGLALEEFRMSPATAPPFHPNRIEGESSFRWCPYNERFIRADTRVRLHRRQSSTRNLSRPLLPQAGEGMYAWYCGGTGESGRGCLMLYAIRGGDALMAYVTIDRDHDWTPHAVQGMDLSTALKQLDDGAARRKARSARIPSEEEALTARLAAAIIDGRMADVVAAVHDDVELSRPDRDGDTPLLIAIIEGRWEIARYLLKAGANPFQQCIQGLSALHTCVLSKGRDPKRFEVARELIAAGVQLELEDMHGLTALHVAAVTENAEMVEVLLAAGADPNAKGPYGSTPLHKAAIVGHLGILRSLHGAGAKVSARTKYRASALMDAAMHGHAAIVEELHRWGASVDAKDKHGNTAVDAARFKGHDDVVQFIESLKTRR